MKTMASTPSQKDSSDKVDEALEGVPELVSKPVTIAAPECILFSLIVTLYSDDIINSINEEIREEIVSNLVTIMNSPRRRRLAQFLIKHGATTAKELIVKFCVSKMVVSRFFDALERCRVIKRVGFVESPYRDSTKRGARPEIIALKSTAPEASIEAQKRYGDLVMSSRELTLELERQQRELERQQREARALEVQTLTDQVFDALPRPLEKDKLTPIYDTMNLVGVDPTLREDVKAAVIRRMSNE